MIPLYTQPRTSQVWKAVAVAGNGQSPTFDTLNAPFVTAFGHASGATTITAYVSSDNTNWYASSTQVLAGAADFCLNVTTGAEFVALQSTNAVTITAWISAK